MNSQGFSAAYAELLTHNRGRLQTTGGDGVYQINYWDVQRFALNLADYGVERKLRDMDTAGIDMSVLRKTVPLIYCPTDLPIYHSTHSRNTRHYAYTKRRSSAHPPTRNRRYPRRLWHSRPGAV